MSTDQSVDSGSADTGSPDSQSVAAESTGTESIDYRGFSELPQVDQNARPPAQRRPRFDGDVSELPDRACWALQHLLTRRYVSAENDADIYAWVLEYRNQLSVRLSELDLLLRVVDGTDVAFVEQARYESAKGIKLLRR
ncbi:DUF4194 domain-containing protein, partial [Mycolicibacterium poriferae]